MTYEMKRKKRDKNQENFNNSLDSRKDIDLAEPWIILEKAKSWGYYKILTFFPIFLSLKNLIRLSEHLSRLLWKLVLFFFNIYGHISFFTECTLHSQVDFIWAWHVHVRENKYCYAYHMDESIYIYIYIYIYIVYVNLVSNLSNTNGRLVTSPQVELNTTVFFSAF